MQERLQWPYQTCRRRGIPASHAPAALSDKPLHEDWLISAKNKSLLDLSMTAYWTIRFRLMRVPGVANVAMWGERIKALVVQVDPDLLRVHNVSLNEVMEKTSEALEFGLLHLQKSAAKTQIDRLDRNPESAARNPTRHPDHLTRGIGPHTGQEPPTAKRFGYATSRKVVWDTPLLIGDAVINDGPGLMLIIEKFPWANTLAGDPGCGTGPQ